jgi:hypothetical protein
MDRARRADRPRALRAAVEADQEVVDIAACQPRGVDREIAVGDASDGVSARAATASCCDHRQNPRIL